MQENASNCLFYLKYRRLLFCLLLNKITTNITLQISASPITGFTARHWLLIIAN